jgi:hypothetical protein
MRLLPIAHSSPTTTNHAVPILNHVLAKRSLSEAIASSSQVKLARVGAEDGEKPAALGKSQGLVLSTVTAQNSRQSRI